MFLQDRTQDVGSQLDQDRGAAVSFSRPRPWGHMASICPMKFVPVCPVARLVVMSSSVTKKGTNKWSLGSQPRPAWTGATPPTPCRAAPTALVRMQLASHCRENAHLIPEPCVRIQSHNPVPCTEINF